MKKAGFIFTILLSFQILFCFGQTDTVNSNLALDKGIGLFKQQKYTEALDLFEKSVKLFPQYKAYYYLAMTGYQLNDTCAFCTNFKKTGNYSSKEDNKLYDSICYKKRIMNYLDKDSSGLYFFLQVTKELCTQNIYREICYKDLKNGGYSTLDIKGYDSTAIMDKNLFINHPELLDVSSEKIIFNYVHDMPEYPGGDAGRIQFLTNNIHYPQFAKEAGIQGTVYVTFIIEINGKVSNISILRGIGGGCDEEVIRIVKLMPNWKPGKVNNKTVRVRFNMPCKFTLN